MRDSNSYLFLKTKMKQSGFDVLARNRCSFQLAMMYGEESLAQECLALLQSRSAIDESLDGTVVKMKLQLVCDA